MSAAPVTIQAARKELASERISAIELVATTLARVESREPVVNAYLHLGGEAAMSASRDADPRASALPLNGIPICVQDVIDVAGMPTTPGSRSWRRYA